MPDCALQRRNCTDIMCWDNLTLSTAGTLLFKCWIAAKQTKIIHFISHYFEYLDKIGKSNKTLIIGLCQTPQLLAKYYKSPLQEFAQYWNGAKIYLYLVGAGRCHQSGNCFRISSDTQKKSKYFTYLLVPLCYSPITLQGFLKTYVDGCTPG